MVAVNSTEVDIQDKLSDAVYSYTIAEGLHKVA